MSNASSGQRSKGAFLQPPPEGGAKPGVRKPPDAELFGFSAYSPKEIAVRVESSGVTKARLPILSQMMLAVLAGAFIGLGALFHVVIRSDPELGYAGKQLLGGLTFSLGLVIVTIAGAELFTGNNLLVMARARALISSGEVLRNWSIVFVGNLIGCAGLAMLVWLARHADMNDGAIAREYIRIADLKAGLSFWTAFFRGILCNALVCLAVWMAMAGRSVTDKVVALIFPVSAFVASGFEHCIANLYFFALALMLQDPVPLTLLVGMVKNLIAVTAGNVIGGGVLVGVVYYLVYLRGTEPAVSSPAAMSSAGNADASNDDRAAHLK